MWTHPATQRNLAQAAADGATLLGVAHGDQACGEVGDGRMLEAEAILEELTTALSPKPLAGRKMLITAGPTFEAIDPVRGITNLSSGKMGFAIARAAREAGAEVTLVAGPVHLDTPRGVRRINVRSAAQMHDAVLPQAPAHDLFVATAAVADWRPASLSAQKIKKDGKKVAPTFELSENPDILAAVAALPDRPLLRRLRSRKREAGAARPREAAAQEAAADRRQPGAGHLRPGRQRAAAGGCRPHPAAAGRRPSGRQADAGAGVDRRSRPAAGWLDPQRSGVNVRRRPRETAGSTQHMTPRPDRPEDP
jgi:hypothetical protein